jgi:hypothetical protein
LDRLLSYLLRRGLRRGLLGGEGRWVLLGGAALLVRLVGKAVKRKPELVYSEKLGVGQRLVITHSTRTGHNGRSESPAP